MLMTVLYIAISVCIATGLLAIAGCIAGGHEDDERREAYREWRENQ